MEANVVQDIQNICRQSGNVTQYFRYGGEGYKNSVSHYLETSSDVAEFAVQPGTVEHLAEIMSVLAQSNTPFAVKCGGHSTNPGFSSTKGGIQISLTRLNNIEYHPRLQEVKVGAGCLFDEVYRALPPDRNIVGGSATQGVGVSGWLLGGGYSLKTNQYGLGIDNLVAVQVVLPNGQIVEASESKNEELFMCVKGGGNNFGIVTEFTLKTHYQPPKINAGLLVYDPKYANDIKAALVQFIDTCKDPKAAVVGAFRHRIGYDPYKITIQYLYDDNPIPNPSPFESFFKIPHKSWKGLQVPGAPERDDSGESSTMSYLEFEQRFSIANHPGLIDRFIGRKDDKGTERSPSTPPPMAGVGENNRGRWATAMLGKYNRAVIDEVEARAKSLAVYLPYMNGLSVTGEVWPFLDTIFQYSTPSAWPHPKGVVFGPQILTATWRDADDDESWLQQLQKASRGVRAVIDREGLVIPNVPYYSNTSDVGMVTTEEVYQQNMPLLRKMKMRFDPKDVMGRAGGFKITA